MQQTSQCFGVHQPVLDGHFNVGFGRALQQLVDAAPPLHPVLANLLDGWPVLRLVGRKIRGVRVDAGLKQAVERRMKPRFR
jgi:hypothetical protein